jgi:alkanesulfonate monooxygenase SsuD/methylene tetrahydromethanopterin reductase-like flavin-dependent oxidoreductase (luciferase family)
VLGVGVGWARQEFDALGVPFAERGRLTDEYLARVRQAVSVPIWVGGNSGTAIRRALRYGDAWHPLGVTLPGLRAAVAEHPLPALTPRIARRQRAANP